MSGTRHGAVKAAAARAGLHVEEYLDLIDSGLLWCWRCRAWQPIDDFAVDRSRGSSRAAACRESFNADQRMRYQPRDRQRGRSLVNPRRGDKKQARRRVNYLVEAGILPRPGDLPCADCGSIKTTARHEYDHYLGYGPEHHEDVEAVCAPCHHRREIDRRSA